MSKSNFYNKVKIESVKWDFELINKYTHLLLLQGLETLQAAVHYQKSDVSGRRA